MYPGSTLQKRLQENPLASARTRRVRRRQRPWENGSVTMQAERDAIASSCAPVSRGPRGHARASVSAARPCNCSRASRGMKPLRMAQEAQDQGRGGDPVGHAIAETPTRLGIVATAARSRLSQPPFSCSACGRSQCRASHRVSPCGGSSR